MREIIKLHRKYFFSTMVKSQSHTIGSDWVLEVTIAGQLDPKSQLVMNLIDLDNFVEPTLSKLNKKSLTELFPELTANQISATQLSHWIYQDIHRHFNVDGVNLLSVSLSYNHGKDWGTYSQTSD